MVEDRKGMWRSPILLLCLWSLPRVADAACCDLIKVEPDPSLTRVRVCDSADGADCAQPRYEGDVGFGAPVAVCTSAAGVIYRELDPLSGAYSAPITARCDDSIDVEL